MPWCSFQVGLSYSIAASGSIEGSQCRSDWPDQTQSACGSASVPVALPPSGRDSRVTHGKSRGWGWPRSSGQCQHPHIGWCSVSTTDSCVNLWPTCHQSDWRRNSSQSSSTAGKHQYDAQDGQGKVKIQHFLTIIPSSFRFFLFKLFIKLNLLSMWTKDVGAVDFNIIFCPHFHLVALDSTQTKPWN